MRKPNGYGAVIKLKGNRRKPYAVRITTGWDYYGKQKFKYLGYYASSKEAEIALADYNKNPFMIVEDLTFKDLYEKYSDESYKNLAEDTVKNYTSAFNSCADLYNIPISKLNLKVLQTHIDTCEDNKPMLKVVKTLWGNMFRFAIRNEWLPPERQAVIKSIDFSKKKNPNSKEHKPFTQEEVDILWNHIDEPQARFILLLIYTGVRISELLKLPEEDIHWDEHYFVLKKAKTEAGIRKVPIADKVYPFMEERYKISYLKFWRTVWNPYMEYLGFDHRPHDTRYTCASFLARAKVDARIIRAIIGHKENNVTERVYTHFEISVLLDAVNQI